MNKEIPSSRQTFFGTQINHTKKEGTLKILNWNIQTPSFKRASKQLKFLESLSASIIVLTEFSFSKSCVLIRDKLEDLGYKTILPEIREDNFGVLIAIKKEIIFSEDNLEHFLSHRSATIKINWNKKELFLTGLYVPPRSINKKDLKTNNRRKEFHDSVIKNFNGFLKTNNQLIVGDFNVPEPETISLNDNISKDNDYLLYHFFLKSGLLDVHKELDKKDSSLFRKEKGYRPDIAFISKALLPSVKDYLYLKEVVDNKLSDHSAILLEIC